MNFLKSLFLVLNICIVIVFSGCTDEPDPVKNDKPKSNGLNVGTDKTLRFNFSHSFGSSPLQLSPKQFFTTNDTIRLTELRYYISNITLTKESGASINLGNYELIDFDSLNPITTISLSNVPEGNYKSFSFLVGVDSVRNTSGAQEGALDPNNGMFWTWNTGYIFFKARGRYSSSNSFALDIGGTGNSIRISYDVAKIAPTSGAPTVSIQLDVQRIFNTPNSYHLGVDADQIHNSGNGSIPKLKANIASAFILKQIN